MHTRKQFPVLSTHGRLLHGHGETKSKKRAHREKDSTRDDKRHDDQGFEVLYITTTYRCLLKSWDIEKSSERGCTC